MLNISRKIWEGVESLLDNYASICSSDKVVVMYTSDSYESAAWVCAALELRGILAKRVWMAPLRDDGFQDRLLTALPSPEAISGRLIVLTFERDTMSYTRTLGKALARYEKHKYAVFRAISASSSLFSETLRILPKELSALNTAILERLMNAKRLTIKTRGGTNLKVEIDTSRYRWISNRGTAKPGGTVVLPAGEVATFPASISGVHVADFAFNVNAITDRDARLHRSPVTIWIKKGRAVRYHCDDTKMSKFLEECFYAHCAYNVGELGFGTNFAVDEAVPWNSHINERRPGVHIGFGQHNQDPGIVNYQCTVHLDLIAKGGMVWVDNDPTPLDLEKIVPSKQPHPITSRDEDVFSPEAEEIDLVDCCGILTNEGLHLCPVKTQ